MSKKIAIPLIINGLTLSLKYSTILYSGSTDLYIDFTIDSYWRGLEDKTVVFQTANGFYSSPMQEDNGRYYAHIPAEVLVQPDHIRIGVQGGDTICTNMLAIDVYQGAEEEELHPMDTIDLEEMCRERVMAASAEPTYLVIDDAEE